MILQGESKAQYLEAEGELATILANFDTNFIYGVVGDLLRETNETFSMTPKVNFVSSLENSFKSMLKAYPLDKDNIIQVRDTTYQEILDIISKTKGIDISYNMVDTDLYSLAKYVYDLFVSRYDIYAYRFLKNFIITQKDYIYQCLDLDAKRKAKDVSTVYNKQIYTDPKLAIINANLDYCLHFINNLDFDTAQTLAYIYYSNEEQSIMQFLLNYLDPNANLYDILIGNIFRNPLLFNPCFAMLKLTGNTPLDSLVDDDTAYNPL